MNDYKNDPNIMEAMKLAQSGDGKALLRLLQENSGQSLQNAMAQAQQGNYEALQKALASALQDPQAQTLLNRLGGNRNG